MRVLYFSRDYTPHDHRFLAALAGAGHQPFYLRLEKRGPELEDRPLPPQVTQVHWVGGRGPARLSQGPGLLFSLRRVIEEVRPDVLHAGPLQTAGLLSALSGFHPFVAASWGYDLLQDAARGPLWAWATRFSLRRADAVVGDCDTIRQKAIAYGARPDRIITFPWGVDIKHFTPSPNGTLASQARPVPDLRSRLGWQENFILLSTRGWEPIYGVEELARAFVLAAHQRPELRLLMLGAGSLAQRLRHIFLQGGVMDQVHFPGQVSQQALPRYYRAADLYVSASHSDGTSISLLEALACGRPALVSDIPGNREWITPGEQGWWFPVGDSQGLATAMLTAIEHQANLGSMGRAARALAEQRADWVQNFPHLLAAYELARAQTGGRAPSG